MNPQLALNLVTDKHFMVAMASETDEQRIDEKIENRFVDLATQLQSEKQTLENDIRYEKEDINRLEEKIKNVEEILEETQMRNQKQIEEIGKKLENEKRDREKAEKESEKIKKEFQQFKTNMVRWVIFVCGLALATLFIWLHHHWLDWLWLHTHKNETLIKLATQLLLVFAFLNIPLKKHWKTWLSFIVAIALGILTLSTL